MWVIWASDISSRTHSQGIGHRQIWTWNLETNSAIISQDELNPDNPGMFDLWATEFYGDLLHKIIIEIDVLQE